MTKLFRAPMCLCCGLPPLSVLEMVSVLTHGSVSGVGPKQEPEGMCLDLSH